MEYSTQRIQALFCSERVCCENICRREVGCVLVASEGPQFVKRLEVRRAEAL